MKNTGTKSENNGEFKQDDIDALVGLKLTTLQAKVYLAIAKLGNPKMSSISSEIQVARQDIYRIAAELHKMGLIEQEITTPVKYRALPLKDGVAILLHRIQKANTAAQEEALKLIKRYEQRGRNSEADATAADIEEIIHVPSGEALLKRIRMSIMTDRTSIDRISPWKSCLQVLLDLGSLYYEALERDVEIRWITEEPTNEAAPDTLQRIMEHPSFELRYNSHRPVAIFAIHDKNEVHISLSAASEERYDSYSGLWSNTPSLVNIAQTCFDSLWNNGHKSRPPFGRSQSNLTIS